MVLSLNRAAKQGNVAKTTLQRALENGDISASKNNKGHWQIDESEFGRWLSARSVEQTETIPENHIGTLEKTTETSVLEKEVELLRERIRDKDDVISDLQRRLDDEAAERRSLTALITDQSKPSKKGLFARIFSSE